MLAATEPDLIDDGERNTPLKITKTKLLKPRHVSRRIAAQDGWFSVLRGTPERLGVKFVSLDTNEEFEKRLGYVRIPPDAFGSIRSQLQTAGINRGVLFPDLDGVAGRVTDGVVEALRFLEAQEGLPLTEAKGFEKWKAALRWLHLLSTNSLDPSDQKVFVVDYLFVPPCFINHGRGLYTFEEREGHKTSQNPEPQREMPLPASYMREVRRQMYVENLEYESNDNSSTLLVHDSAFKTLAYTMINLRDYSRG